MFKYKNILINASLIISSWAVVEIILQLAGYIYLKQYKKEVNFKDTKEIRILCIGESTTALGGKNSYPSLLEFLLQKELPNKKIVVINEGVPGRIIYFMRNNFELKLNKYRPHYVIVMAGINDLILSVEDRFGKTTYTEKIKLIKFFKIAYINLKAKFIKEKLAGEGIESTESKKHNKIFFETINLCKSSLSSCEKNIKKLVTFINNLTLKNKYFTVDFEDVYLNRYLLKNKSFYREYKNNVIQSNILSKEFTLYRLNKVMCDMQMNQCKKINEDMNYNPISRYLAKSKT